MSDRPQRMSDSHIQAGLENLPNWSLIAGKLHREYRFKNFAAAFGFMASVALEAEKMNHHPEWFNVWATVRVDLNTHDAGGITELDFRLAEIMEALASTSKEA